jgi:hypothetical protein
MTSGFSASAYDVGKYGIPKKTPTEKIKIYIF